MILGSLNDATTRRQNIRARVVIERSSKWVLRLSTDSIEGHGERQLEGESCWQASEALALILAMLIDPEAVKWSATSDLNTRKDSSVLTVAPVVEAPSATSAMPVGQVDIQWGMVMPKKRVAVANAHLQIAVGTTLNFGLERLPRLGMALSLDQATGPMHWFATGSYWLQHEVSMAHDDTRGAKVNFGSIGASVGPSVWRTPFEVVPRAGILGSAVNARGYGVDVPSTQTVYWWSATLGNAILAHFGPLFSAQLALDLLVPLRRPAVQLDPGGDVIRPAGIGAQAYLLGGFHL